MSDRVPEHPSNALYQCPVAGSGSPPEPSPAPPDRCCTCLGTCRGAEGLGPRWYCALKGEPSKAGPLSSGVEPLGDLRVAIDDHSWNENIAVPFYIRDALASVEALVSRLSKERDAYRRNATAYLYDAKVAVREREALRAERDGWHREAEINAQECAKQFNAWCGASAENAVLRQALRKIVIMVTPQEAMVIARAALSGAPAEKGEQ